MTVETAMRKTDVKKYLGFGIRYREMAKHTLFTQKKRYRFRKETVMWYVIQVTTGKEEETKHVIERELDHNFYTHCFYIKRERVWRRDGQCIVHVETMFPGYLFVTSDMPKELYQELKRIPKLTKLLRAEDDVFLAVDEEEEIFLKNLLDGDAEHVVRLSKVEVDEEKNIVKAEGPLRHYMDKIVKKKLRLRYVIIEMRLFEKNRQILIGIRCQEDM